MSSPKKSVNERTNNRVFDGEWRDCVRQIEIRMTAFPREATKRLITLTIQLATKHDHSLVIELVCFAAY